LPLKTGGKHFVVKQYTVLLHMIKMCH